MIIHVKQRKLFHTHIGRVKPSDPPINIFFFTNYNIPTIPTQALSLRKKEIKASNDVIPHGKPLSLFLCSKETTPPFIENFIENGGDIAFLSDLLGHDSIETTHIYLRRTSTEQAILFNRVVDW